MLPEAPEEQQELNNDLHEALTCRRGADRIAEVLKAGADPNARDGVGDTPLHKARTDTATWVLVTANAWVNARNQLDETPLHRARDSSQANALIEAGAELEARDQRGRTPAQRARAEVNPAPTRPGHRRQQDLATFLEAAEARKQARDAVQQEPHGSHSGGAEHEAPTL